MRLLLCFLVIVIYGCQKKGLPSKSEEQKSIAYQDKKTFQAGKIFADNQFDGARLNGFKLLNDSTIRAIISPENTPINNSPWYAFRLWSDTATRFYLELQYTTHHHRYIPKLSLDGKTWKSMNASDIIIDTAHQKARLSLHLTKDTLWLAAQEIISSKKTYEWANHIAQIPFAQKKIIGRSVLNKPIFSYEFNEGKGEKALILIGRQHPPEVPGGTLSIQSFMNEILSDSELAQQFRQHFEVVLIPLLNPDGADLGHWRHNANGIDLNRDWQAFSQPETQAVRKYVKNKDFCFGIDFHTSYSGPYLLVLDSLNTIKTQGIIPAWIQRIEGALTDHEIDARPRSQGLPYCYNWMINELGIEAVTYEEGDEIDRAIIHKRAKVYSEKLMETLLETHFKK